MNIAPISNDHSTIQRPFGERLTTGWQLCESPAGAWPDPAALERAVSVVPGERWFSCQVPGTVAQALQLAGQFDPHAPRPLHDSDFWYRREICGDGIYALRCEGLATLAQVFLDGKLIGESSSMYLPLTLTLNLHGRSILCIAFRSLTVHLAGLKPPRARWRVAMVHDQNLRAVRTTLLGHMPSWCPEIHLVGPWQAIHLISARAISQVQLHATVCGEGGLVRVELTCGDDLGTLTVSCAGAQALLQRVGEHTYAAQIDIAQVQRWWPRGMGAQALYEVSLQRPDATLVLGKVGFRRIELDQGVDGRDFALIVNGVKMFARGAVYTPPKVLHPGGEEGLVNRLDLLAEMGANMLRVAGPFCYESTAFYRRCDELGLLVWQDLMLANFDYPLANAAFATTIELEVKALLHRIAGSPSLAVLCGGSEIQQQAAMLGLSDERRRQEFFSQALPAICARLAPDLIVVSNSPSGGDLPFSVREGISHYFGVGAYERPLDDARRANPRFMTECLAFSNVPEPISLAIMGVPAVHHPAWKSSVPRDRGASWDFEDTRDHYLSQVFGLDPARLRRTDPSHYLAASRALCAYIFSSTLAQWRRPASSTGGALIFTAGDLILGAGWGLIDARGEPKSTFYALRQVCQPISLFLTDEGCDGVDIHLVNDRPEPVQMQLRVRLLRHGQSDVGTGTLNVDVAARSGLTVSVNRVLGVFTDVSYVFRFGQPNHDTVHVSASEVGGGNSVPPLDACFFPLGPYATPAAFKIHVQVIQNAAVWWLEISTDSVARFVQIDDQNYRPQDNCFHLVPGSVRRVRLIPRSLASDMLPMGAVSALNCLASFAYRGLT
jgi:beta-mannosidase